MEAKQNIYHDEVATDSKNTSPFSIYKWSDLPVDRPMDLVERRRIIGEKMMISQVLLGKGFSVESHQHANEQMVCVIRGLLHFGLGVPGSKDYREVKVGTGEVLHLPANFPHSATALEESLVWDLFSPPSQMTGIDKDTTS